MHMYKQSRMIYTYTHRNIMYIYVEYTQPTNKQCQAIALTSSHVIVGSRQRVSQHPHWSCLSGRAKIGGHKNSFGQECRSSISRYWQQAKLWSRTLSPARAHITRRNTWIHRYCFQKRAAPFWKMSARWPNCHCQPDATAPHAWPAEEIKRKAGRGRESTRADAREDARGNEWGGGGG